MSSDRQPKKAWSGRAATAASAPRSNGTFDVLKDTLIDVKGRVVDEKGEPLAGATVRVKGTDKATSTDESGNFALKNVDDGDVLMISYVGFETQEIKVNGKTNLGALIVKSSVTKLDEVDVTVNTGYQKMLPKERATGSVVVIDNELLNRRVGTDVLSRLEGATSGVFVFN